jgi:hypothetical protein
MGSGLTPPNQGFRSLWISSTTMRPPASSRPIQPAPQPVEVQGAAHVGFVAAVGIEALDDTRPFRVLEGAARRLFAGAGADDLLDSGQDGRVGSRPRG